MKQFPQLNAEIQGTDIIYKNYYDIGVAVSSKKGLLVPIIRNAERMSFAEIEQTVSDFGKRAQSNKISPEELQGGTFTISNGGVFGSLDVHAHRQPATVGRVGDALDSAAARGREWSSGDQAHDVHCADL